MIGTEKRYAGINVHSWAILWYNFVKIGGFFLPSMFFFMFSISLFDDIFDFFDPIFDNRKSTKTVKRIKGIIMHNRESEGKKCGDIGFGAFGIRSSEFEEGKVDFRALNQLEIKPKK